MSKPDIHPTIQAALAGIVPPQADKPDVVIDAGTELDLCCILEDYLEWDITRTDNGVEPVRVARLLTKRIAVDVTECEDLPGPAGACWACDLSDVVGGYEREVRFRLTDLRWRPGKDTPCRAIATIEVEADGD